MREQEKQSDLPENNRPSDSRHSDGITTNIVTPVVAGSKRLPSDEAIEEVMLSSSTSKLETVSNVRQRALASQSDEATTSERIRSQSCSEGSNHCKAVNKKKSRKSAPDPQYMHVFNIDEHVEDENKVEDLKTSDKKYPTVFRWNTGNHDEVYLAGSFNNWRQKIPLVKSEGEFYTVLDVPEGTHQYKYLVDGEWTCHPNEPRVDNDVGTQNNVVTIRSDECDIYQVLLSDSLGAAYNDPLASPPGSYSQHMPAREVSYGFQRFGPPLLPPQLLDTVLNHDVSAHCEPMMVPEPNHVVLNHLYTLSIKGGVMVLSSTHRYRKKYITTLLYKPI